MDENTTERSLDTHGVRELHSSAPNHENRPKVLCLGISSPDIRLHMEKEGYSSELATELLDNQKHASSTDLVVECVRRNILTEMDGRDLSRILAMEHHHNVSAYTVSQESGCEYSNRHIHANFNRTSSFIRSIQQNFGIDVRFRQIILDYFWIPKGTWVMSHWARSFFRETLPRLVEHLEYPEPSDDISDGPLGIVYLPFCLHCMKELVANNDVLKKYYKISFVYQWELHEHLLWNGTQTIQAETMQQWLGKKRDQEEVYCTFNSRDVYETMEDRHVTKPQIEQVLRGISDFASVRMVRMQPLAHHNPALKDKQFDATPENAEPAVQLAESATISKPLLKKLRSRQTPQSNKQEGVADSGSTCKKEVGGFISLLPPSKVVRGYDDSTTSDDKSDDCPSVESTAEESMSSTSLDAENEESAKIDLPTINHAQPKKVRSATQRAKSDTRVKRRCLLYRPVPDLETYIKLGQKESGSITSRYQVHERDHPCNIINSDDEEQPVSAIVTPHGRFADRLDLIDFVRHVDEMECKSDMPGGDSFDKASGIVPEDRVPAETISRQQPQDIAYKVETQTSLTKLSVLCTGIMSNEQKGRPAPLSPKNSFRRQAREVRSKHRSGAEELELVRSTSMPTTPTIQSPKTCSLMDLGSATGGSLIPSRSGSPKRQRDPATTMRLPSTLQMGLPSLATHCSLR